MLGSIEHYYNYIKKTISNICTIHDGDDDIILHYTKNRSFPNNHAWRTIHWDLFSEYVPQDY